MVRAAVAERNIRSTYQTFLPFLFCTRTILQPFQPVRSNSTYREHENEARPKSSSDGLTRLVNASTRRSKGEEYHGRRDRQLQYKGKYDRQSYTSRNTSAVSRSAWTPRPRDNRTSVREDHVPFENGTASGNTLESLVTSTMTWKERQAFASLLKKRPVQAQESGEASPAESVAKSTAISKEHSQVTMHEEDVSTPAAQQYHTLRKAISDAQTDHELWDIMNKEILDPVRAMNLDTSQDNTHERIQELENLAKYLPKNLVDVIKSYGSKFPSSMLGLMVLPNLRKAGPAAFALGASTELYNLHMRFLYRKHLDLDGIITLLTEMDREVYIPDHDTLEFISSICEYRKQAINGNFGSAQAALWSTDRTARAVRQLRHWRRRVQDRLKEEALRKAQEEAAEREAVSPYEEETSATTAEVKQSVA